MEIINHEDAYLEQGNRITERLGTDRYDGVESLTLKGHFELNRFMDFTTVLQIYEGAKYWQVTVSEILAVALLAMIFLYIRKK